MRALVIPLLLLTSMSALGQDDADALLLADKTAATPETSSDWHVYTEGATSGWRPQGTGPAEWGTRLSLDAKFDKTFAPGWRAVFADRLDMTRMDRVAGDGNVNTLKEAYLSWQLEQDRIADLGRINVRNGVAMGYNPTDYFRVGALRSIVSPDPASLRENRLGSAMLRGQALWSSGSLTALYSPKLANQPSTAVFSTDFGASNQRDRWQIALSEKLSNTFNPQWLLSGGTGQTPQLGLNLTVLPNDATVAYMEWSGGRAESLAAKALKDPDDTAFRSRLATGLTYTTTNKISLSAEYEYNGTGLKLPDWNSLRHGPLAAYGLYRTVAASLQELPTSDNVFLYAVWQDALIKNFDLTAMVRNDLVDHSQQHWLEARYHWPKVDIALQIQVNKGDPTSTYGVLPYRSLWQAVARYYF